MDPKFNMHFILQKNVLNMLHRYPDIYGVTAPELDILMHAMFAEKYIINVRT